MPNINNLKPFSELSEERKREIQEMGRKANKEKWEQKKMLKDLLEYGLGIETDKGNNAVEITEALIKEAIDGNVRAYEVIRDTIGQKPVERQEVSATINDPFDELTVEELKKLANDD